MIDTRRFRVAAVIALSLASSSAAQMPGAPVLQNVWANAGVVGAVNMGGGSAGSIYAAAGSWTPSSGRFQLSGGLGVQARTIGARGTSSAYGIRVAVPMASATSSFGFGAFAGVGGGGARRVVLDSITGDTVTSKSAATQIPIGVAVGWRHSIGETHGVSLYASPSYLLLSGGGSYSGLMRIGLGADVGITQSIGLTGGVELGQSRTATGGPPGTVYGLGVSYAFGRR